MTGARTACTWLFTPVDAASDPGAWTKESPVPRPPSQAPSRPYGTRGRQWFLSFGHGNQMELDAFIPPPPPPLPPLLPALPLFQNSLNVAQRLPPCLLSARPPVVGQSSWTLFNYCGVFGHFLYIYIFFKYIIHTAF